jgi:hypothetical protein
VPKSVKFRVKFEGHDAVTICTTRFNIQTFYILPTDVLYGSQGKQRVLTYTELTDRVLITKECVYCAVRTGSLNKTDYVSSLKGQ